MLVFHALSAVLYKTINFTGWSPARNCSCMAILLQLCEQCISERRYYLLVNIVLPLNYMITRTYLHIEALRHITQGPCV